MRQVRKSEEKKIEEHKLFPLVIGVFSDNLESYVFPQLKLKWRKKEKEEFSNISFIFLIDGSTIFLIENYSHYANLFLMIPEISEKHIPTRSNIIKSLNKLNINDQQVWFNEWHFLPKHAKNLNELITNWINKDYSLTYIKKLTEELTKLGEVEVKNLLTSHQLLSGSSRLKEIYP